MRRFSPLAAGLALAAAAGATEYEYTDPVYRVSAAAGVTNELSSCSFTKTVGGVETASSWSEFSAATSGTLVKSGDGWVRSTSDLSSFEGAFHIERGVFKVENYYGLGALTAGEAYVHDGATLYMDDPSGQDLPSTTRKVIYIEGTGVSSLGAALYANTSKATKDNDSDWPLMQSTTLTGDATIVIEGGITLYSNWRAPATINPNGHTLTFKRSPLNTGNTYYLQNATLVSAGNIVCDHILYKFRSSAGLEGGSECLLKFQNGAEAYLENSASPKGDGLNWTLEFVGTSLFNLTGLGDEYVGYNLSDVDKMAWKGPVRLNGEIQLFNASKTDTVGNHKVGLNLHGQVSGDYGIRTLDAADSKRQYKSDFKLGLLCPTNTFKGGVNLEGGDSVLALYANGALPKDGGAATVRNGSVQLVGDDVFELPDLNIVGTGLVYQSSLSGGKWKNIVKTGEGVLDYRSVAGADILEVREGGVRLSHDHVAGLVKSVWTNATSTTSAMDDWNSSLFCSPVTTQLTAKAAYAWAFDEGWAQNTVIAYRGYIRNPDPTNVNWSFVLMIDHGARLILDGIEVTRNPKRFYPVRQTTTLTPGFHEFELRLYCGYNGGQRGALTDTENLPAEEKSEWKNLVKGNGFMLDRLGRNSRDVSNYARLLDPGDGSLFVTTTNMTEIAPLLPAFEKMKFASGTTLDLTGLGLSQGDFEGYPAVANGDLTITGSWSVEASAIAAGAKLTTSGKLTLASGAKIVVTEASRPPHCPAAGWTFAEAAGGIVLSPDWKDSLELPNKTYDARLSDDGKKLILYRNAGMIVIIR